MNRLIDKIAHDLAIDTSTHSIINIEAIQHVEWLAQRRLDIENGKHWPTYRKFCSSKLSKNIIQELDKSTDSILGRIEDPLRKGSWSSRGLVIGDVQSGKTTNFLGVITKALDAGYKIIVVLSGLHNNLRVQTQERFEEGVTGINTKNDAINKLCGVAKFTDKPEELRLRV